MQSYCFVDNYSKIPCFVFLSLSAIPRPPSTYSLQAAIDGKEELLLATVTAVAEDDFVREPSLPLSPPVKRFADKCKERMTTAGSQLQVTFQHFAALLTLFWPTIAITEKHSLYSDRKRASSIAFFQLRNGEAMWEKAMEVFTAFGTGLEIPHMFIQLFTRILHEKLLENNEKIPSAPQDTSATQLNQQEQKALRYTAGYIVNRLARKVLRKQESDKMQAALENMKKGSDKETRLSYTREWVEIQSRGGLVLINDSTFLFFEVIEKLIRNRFPKTIQELRDTDLREGVMTCALQDKRILEKWTLLTAGTRISESASLVLLQMLLSFYTQVRGFSFAKNIVERFKIINKQQGKKSKGVRTSLKRSETTDKE